MIPPVQILLVDDDDSHVELIRRAFKKFEHPVEFQTAGNLREARRLLDAHPFELIIADLRLPDGEGTSLLGPSFGEPDRPLILMTGFGDEQVAVAAMRSGALDYVVKSEQTLKDMPRIAARGLREWNHIRERRRAERALQESYRLVQGVLDSLWTLLAVVDDRGKIIMVNLAWKQYAAEYSLSVDPCGLGSNYLEICAEASGDLADDAHRAAIGIRQVLDGGSQQFAMDYRRDAEEPRWVRLTVTPFSGAGAARAVLLHEDVTELKEAAGRAERRAEILALLSRLSRREREVLTLVVSGKANKVIAKKLDISVKTVEMHRGNVMRKLSVETVQDLVRLALSAGVENLPV